jgi:para-aminobenzoate synthetase component 1
LEKVFHTYGIIRGKLKSFLHPIEALLSMSPGGSISGCPKKRACEIIHGLESQARGIYTGTIGYILPDGTLNFNIAIRTVTQIGTDLTLGVGGGITIESNNENEYMETLMKASSFQP